MQEINKEHDKSSLGYRLKRIQFELCVSQKYFAIELGVAQSAISRYPKEMKDCLIMLYLKT